MNYAELKQTFLELKRTFPKEDLTAHIIFTENSFAKEYPLLNRTYHVSSDNKGFYPHMFSNSIFAYCLDVSSDQAGQKHLKFRENMVEYGAWKWTD